MESKETIKTVDDVVEATEAYNNEGIIWYGNPDEIDVYVENVFSEIGERMFALMGMDAPDARQLGLRKRLILVQSMLYYVYDNKSLDKKTKLDYLKRIFNCHLDKEFALNNDELSNEEKMKEIAEIDKKYKLSEFLPPSMLI
jgi:hypothetical protein